MIKSLWLLTGTGHARLGSEQNKEMKEFPVDCSMRLFSPFAFFFLSYLRARGRGAYWVVISFLPLQIRAFEGLRRGELFSLEEVLRPYAIIVLVCESQCIYAKVNGISFGESVGTPSINKK